MHLKRVLSIAILLSFIELIPTFAATTIFKSVKKSGGNFTSIGAAVQAIPADLVAANQSWIIEVQDDGTYIERTVLISGKRTDASHTITIRVQSGRNPTFKSGTYGPAFRISYEKYVTLDGLHIIGEYNGTGIATDGSQYLTIRSCTILNSDGDGISLNSTSDSVLEFNKVYSCHSGIHLHYSCRNNRIESNKLYHALQVGIILDKQTNQNVIRRNLFYNNPTSIYFTSNAGIGNLLEDNTIVEGSRSQFAYRFDSSMPVQTLSNFNGIYMPNSSMGKIGTQTFHTLAEWQSTFLDLNSTTQDPNLAVLDPTAYVTPVFKTVKKSGGDFSTISAALNAAPVNLMDKNESWVIEIQDSATYVEAVRIGGFTSPDHSITLRAKSGEKPVIAPLPYKSAIEFHDAKYATVDGLTMRGMRKGSGAYFWGGIGCVLKNNTIYDDDYPAIAVYGGHHHQVMNNIVHHSAVGLDMYYYTHSSVVKNNLFYKNGIYGFSLRRNIHNNTFENNTLYDNSREVVIWSDMGKENVFKNNIIYNTRQNVAIEIMSKIPAGTVFDYNNVYAPVGRVGQVSYINLATYRTLAEWQTYSGLEFHSISQDPLFASTQNGSEDFHLKTQTSNGRFNPLNGVFDQSDPVTSPSIDVGDPTSEFSLEPQGNGGRVNQGVYGNTAQASKSGAPFFAPPPPPSPPPSSPPPPPPPPPPPVPPSGPSGMSYGTNVSLALTNASYVGEQLGDQVGIQISGVGDIDHDGFDDVLVGANQFNQKRGKVYLFYGRSTKFDLKNLNIKNADASFIGEGSGQQLGANIMMKAGDVDKDGYGDFLIAAFYSSEIAAFAGKVYLVYGGPRQLFTKDMEMSAVTHVSFRGEVAQGLLGYDMGAADLDKDGYSDFVLFSRTGDLTGGKAYVFFGGTRSLFSQNMNVQSAAQGTFVTGHSILGMRGLEVGGDLDNDGYPDLAFSSYGGATMPGKLYLYFGGSRARFTQAVTLEQSADASFLGENLNDLFSNDISMQGDLNGDGFSDLVTATNSDYDKLYVIFGKPRPFFLLNQPVALAHDASFVGEQAQSDLGFIVSTAGDANGDGLSDLLVYSNQLQKIYVYLGHLGVWNKNVNIASSQASFVAENNLSYYPYRLNFIGDINHDGKTDIGVGHPSYNDVQNLSDPQWSQKDRGKAYIVYP